MLEHQRKSLWSHQHAVLLQARARAGYLDLRNPILEVSRAARGTAFGHVRRSPNVGLKLHSTLQERVIAAERRVSAARELTIPDSDHLRSPHSKYYSQCFHTSCRNPPLAGKR